MITALTNAESSLDSVGFVEQFQIERMILLIYALLVIAADFTQRTATIEDPRDDHVGEFDEKRLLRLQPNQWREKLEKF